MLHTGVEGLHIERVRDDVPFRRAESKYSVEQVGVTGQDERDSGRFSRYVKEDKKSLKYTKIYLT